MNKVKLSAKAEEFSRKNHEGQKQATGKPYFEHPLEVARLLKSWNQDEEVVATGYLHDVVEDCNIPLTQIEKEFGNRVAYLVDGMSWVRGQGGEKDFDATYRKFASYSIREPSLALIKIADLISNIPNLAEPSHREWVIKKSYPRNMAFYVPFMKAVGLTALVDRVIKEFHKYIQTPVNSVLYDYISREELKKIKSKLPKLT